TSEGSATMKKILLTFAVLSAVAGMGNPLQAAFITGQQAFGSDATTSASNSIGDTSFSFTWTTLSGGGSQTGDFVGAADSFAGTVNATVGSETLVFGNASFGTFAFSSVNVNNLIPGVSRTLNFSGTFTPGPGLGPFDPTPATLTITINQA